MKLQTLVWREIFERKNQLATSFLAILLGVSVIVAMKDITYYSEKAVAYQLDALGANILVLPKSASLQDYYSADVQNDVFPEEYVKRLTTSDLQGLDNLSPKLSVPVEAGGRRFILTGILPRNEFLAKAAWQMAGLFSRPSECGAAVTVPAAFAPARETLVRKRVIQTLGTNEVLVGADMAATLKLAEGSKVQLLGRSFTVTAILPQTGTVDDGRVFGHLHAVRSMLSPLFWAGGVGVGVCVVASYLPARRAARLDPSAALQET
jgi:putative ABC transport system permease protein